MSVQDALARLGGVASRAELVDATSRAEVEQAVRTGAVIRIRRGRYGLSDTPADLVAAQSVAGVLCLESAALQWGWAVKHPPDRPQVSVPPNRRTTSTRANAVELHRIRFGCDDVVDGVTSRERTLSDCLRLLRFDRALAVADSALRDGFPAALLAALARDARGPGSRRMRRVTALAHPAAANPFESTLRAIALGVDGLRVQPQVTIRRPETHGGSRRLGRADLVDEELRVILEADSFEWHGHRSALAADARRYNAFVVAGWLVLRFSWEEVMFHPERVAAVLRQAVDERTQGLCPRCRTAS